MPGHPPSTKSDERLVFTLDEAAACLGVHRQSLRSAIERGELRAVRLGRRWLVPVSAVDDLIQGRHHRFDGPKS
jgi:excisionase family DNA binding protein